MVKALASLILEACVRVAPARHIIDSPKRWKIGAVKWKKWQKDINFYNEIIPADVETINSNFVNAITSASNLHIPMTTGKTQVRHHTAWWDMECRLKVEARKKARRLCERHPTQQNVESLKKLTAEAKYCIKKKKRKSWQNFVGSLTPDTPIGEVWNKINKIKGIYKHNPVPIIRNFHPIVNPTQKVEILAEYFSEVTKSKPLKLPLDFKDEVEKSELSNNKEDYNSDLMYGEFLSALSSVRNTSPGEDNVLNTFLKNLSPDCKEYLFYVFNVSWCTR